MTYVIIRDLLDIIFVLSLGCMALMADECTHKIAGLSLSPSTCIKIIKFNTLRDTNKFHVHQCQAQNTFEI